MTAYFYMQSFFDKNEKLLYTILRMKEGIYMNPIILSLDISTTSTGYGIFKDNKLITYGCITPTGNVITRIEKTANKINDLMLEYNPDIIYAEEPEPALKSNIDVYRKLTFAHGAIAIILNHYKKELKICTSSHWRKQVGIKTGAGITRAQLKPVDVAKANELFNLNTKNDDIADAVLIGQAYINEYCKEEFNWE